MDKRDNDDLDFLKFLSRADIAESSGEIRNVNSMLSMESLLSGTQIRIFRVQPGVAGIIAGEVSAITRNYVAIDMYQSKEDKRDRIQNTAVVEKSHIDKKDLAIGDHVAIRYFSDGSKMGNVIELLPNSEFIVSVGGITDEYPELRQLVLKALTNASQKGTRHLTNDNIKHALSQAVKEFCEPRGFEMDGDSASSINVQRIFTSQVKKDEISCVQTSVALDAYNSNPRRHEQVAMKTIGTHGRHHAGAHPLTPKM